MSNSLVDEYRRKVPNDPRSDAELTVLFGRQNEIDGRYNNRQDFVKDYQSIISENEQPRVIAQPTLAGEFGKGFRRGVEGLKESAYGLGALALDLVDEEKMRNALLQKYAESQARAAMENAPEVGRIEDIGSVGDAAKYLATKAGEMVPMVGEALLTGAAGAAIGSAAGPEGTVAGAGAGLGEGFFARQAAKSLLKSNLKRILGDEVVEAAVRSQLQKIAAREAITELAPQTRTLIESQIKSVAKKMGATGANVLNFYGIGSGGTFGALANRPGAEDPQVAAIISGVGSAAGAVLPTTVIAKLFPGVGEEVARNYLMRLAKDAAKEIPIGASGMGVMELANIAAERYSDPKRSGEPLNDEELSRIRNAIALGGLMGAAASPISAIRGPKVYDSALEQHFAEVSPERRKQLEDLKARMARPNPSAEDITASRTMTPAEHAFYVVAEPGEASPREAPAAGITPAASEQPPPPAARTVAPGESSEPAPSEAVPAQPTAEQQAAAANQERMDRAKAMALAANTPTGTSPVDDATLSRVRAAEAATDRNPSPAQKASGNYSKGKVDIQGLKISVENPKGSERSGIGPDGEPWSVQLPATYGYILGSVGKDKDHIDVYIGPKPEGKTVYVVDQVDPATGKFDEHKVMLGYESQAGAEATYDAAFSDASGPQRRGAVTAMSMEDFKSWLNSGKTKEPIGKLPVREESNANRQQETMEVGGGQQAVAAPQVPEGKPGDVQKPAGTIPNEPAPKANGQAEGNAPGVKWPELQQAYDQFNDTGEIASTRELAAKVGALVDDGKAPKSLRKPIREYADALKEDFEQHAGRSGLPEEAENALLTAIEKVVRPKETRSPGKTTAATKGALDLAPIQSAKTIGELDAAIGRLTKERGSFSADEQKLLRAAVDAKTKELEAQGPAPGDIAKNISPLSASLKKKIDQAKVELASLLKEWDEESTRLPRQNLKLSLDPRDYIGVSPKVLELQARAAKKVIEIGAYKFADFVAGMVDLLGEKILPFVTRLYESIRDYYTPDPKTNKAGDPALIEKLTPRSEMAAAIDKLAKELKREDMQKTHAFSYAQEHVIKPSDIDIEARGTTGKSGRRGGVNEKAREAWEMERAAEEEGKLRPWDKLTAEEKDAFIQSKPELAKESLPVEPAWFVPKERNFDRLSKRLLSDSSPPQKVDGKTPNNSMTYRLAALLDRDTGQVHLVSVFKNNRDVRVTKFGDEVFGKGGARKSYSLRDILEAKSELGGRRFEVIGSARTKNLTEYYQQTFATRKEFREQFVKDLEERQAAVQSHAVETAERMQGNGAVAEEAKSQIDEEAAKAQSSEERPAAELPVTETAEAVDVDISKASDEHPSPERLNLDAADVKTLIDELPGIESVDDLTDMITSPDSTKLISDRLYSVIEKVLSQDKFFFRRVINDGVEKVLKDYGYETDNLNAGKAEPVQPGAVAQATPGVSDIGGGSGGGVRGPEAAVAGRENPPGQTQPAGPGEGAPATETRNPVAGGESTEGLSFNTPVKADQVADPEAARMINSIHEAAAAAGIDTHLLKGRLAGAVYDPKQRAFYQVLGDTVGRQDVKTAFHEVGHDVFASEAPDVRQRILKAIDSLSDEALGVDTSADPRIHASDPYNLGAAKLQEERLVEATAERLVREGFDPQQSQGLAQRFVRALKDMYYRAAFWAQDMLGFNRNPELARKYFENRVRRLLSGDNSPVSYLEWVGAVKPSSGERQRDWFPSSKNSAERLDEFGALDYDFQGDHTLAAGRFNIDRALRYNLPVTDPNYSRTVEVEKLAATYNHQLDLIDRMAAAMEEKFADKIAAAKAPAREFMLGLLNIADPKILREQLKDARETNGEPVAFDPEKRVGDFKHQAQQDAVTSNSYRGTSALLTKLGRLQVRATESLESLQRRVAEAQDRYVKAREHYTDFQYQTTEVVNAMRKDLRLLFKEASGIYKRQGVISQQLKALNPKAVLKDYVPAFEKLFTGGELEGRKLMDILDAAANDPSIDFRRPVTELRAALYKSKSRDAYEPLLSNSKESDALLAAVAAFAKTHKKVMAELELRRDKERSKIEASVQGLDENKQEFSKGLRELARTAKLEERYRAGHVEAARELRTAKRALGRAQDRIRAIETVAPVIHETLGALSGQLQLGANTVWGDGMVYHVPEKPTASNAEVLAGARKISLNSAGAVSNPVEIEANLTKMAQWMAERQRRYNEGDIDAKDGTYQAVYRQFREIAEHKNFSMRLGPAQRFLFELNVLPAGKRIADAFGTPAARMVDQLINRFTDVINELRPSAERIGRKNDQLEGELLKMMPGIDRDYLRENFLTPAKYWMERQHHLEEAYADNPAKLRRAIYDSVRDMLLKNEATGRHVKGVIGKFMPALEKLIDFQHESNQFLIERVRRAETGVKDPKLQVFNPVTGKMEAGIRRHLSEGAYTWTRKLSRTFGTMVNAMRNSDWDSFQDAIKGIDEVYREQGPEAASAALARFFNHPEYHDQVQNSFFRALAEMDNESPFHAPAMEDAITRPPADPALVREAFALSKADPVKFAEHLYDLHGVEGAQAKDQFVRETLETLSEIYSEISGMRRKHEPDGTDIPKGVRNMSPDVMIDARSIDHLPATWFDYHSFDQRDMFKMVERIAAQTAFARNQERLGQAVDTVAAEVRAAQDRLTTGIEEIKRANPMASAKEIESALKTRFGKEEYARLSKMVKRGRFVDQTVRELSDYFRRDHGPDGTLRAAIRAAQLLGSLLVNQPSSALAQMAALIDINIRYGASPSTLAASARAVGLVGKELAASLAQAVGIQILNGAEGHRRFVDLGLTDPAAFKKLRDVFDRLEGEAATTHFFRGANDALGMGVNLLGEKAEHTVIRPLQPFTTSAIAANKAITEQVWNFVGNYIAKGVEFYKANPEKFADANHRLSSGDLRMNRFETDSFNRLHEDMQRWGLNYDDMVRGAMGRADKTMFTDAEALRLYSMAMSDVSSESNLSTMPLQAYNNKLIRVATPLLGWSFRRMVQVGSLRLSPEGQHSMQSLLHGLAGLGVTAVGGLALSALIDEYYKDLLGKQRNLRPVLGAPNATQAAMGVLEQLNRIGTFGFFGELANSAINVGQGGDNRMISVDQRVVALSALQSVMRAITSWMHQGEADYAHVVRPLASSLGGGGLLQYMQIANKALGFDNPEARLTARMNAQNYLRVVGRQLELDVREYGGGGGYSVPTPISPYLTRMEMAAYADNRGEFMEQYRMAIEAARGIGTDDPVAYIKRAYASRNPLRQVFRTPPTETQYRQILSALPEDGRGDVSQAVNLFNRYADEIGARSFEGKSDKPNGGKLKPEKPKAPVFDTNLIRRRQMISSLFAR